MMPRASATPPGADSLLLLPSLLSQVAASRELVADAIGRSYAELDRGSAALVDLGE